MEKCTLTKSDTLPITINEAKLWCRIDGDTEDLLIEGLIMAATEAAEAATNRTLRAAQIEYRFPYNKRAFSLPTSPVRSISKVEIEDCNGIRSVLTLGTEYMVATNDAGANVRLLTYSASLGCVVITADVGYDDTDAIPRAIKQAIAVHVGSAYAGREGQDSAAATFTALLAPLRVELL